MIPYARQDISQADIDSVIEVLRSDFITQGPIIPRFEGSVAHYCGAKNAVAVNSATSAALRALRLALGQAIGSGQAQIPSLRAQTLLCIAVRKWIL